MADQYAEASPQQSPASSEDRDAYDGMTPGAYWHAQLDAAEKAFERYIEKAKKVVKRYRDERDAIESQRKKFNILWSNIQVLFPALYGRKPEPDVSRRYLDNDPPSRLASMMLERAIKYEIDNFSDFDTAMCGAVQDRLLPGRGTSWVRYEPNIVQMEEPQESPEQEVAQEGAQITEDTEESPQAEPAQRVVSAHSPVDYVFWQDFLHSPARTWEEVWWVSRWVYMTKDEGLERFGEVFKLVPCEQVAPGRNEWQQGTQKDFRAEMEKKAKVAEVWNKRTGKVCWVAKGYPEALDERDDFLHLDGFFPCPKPLFSTLTTGSLIPIPDFCEYQDQASELDDLTQRIYMLTKACKAVGVFNAEYKELQRLLNEGVDNRMFPITDWNSFAEKNGLAGAFQLMDVKGLIQILAQLYEARNTCKETIYEVTGLSDIIRGSSLASETATAQQLKANFGSLRLRSSQGDVARYASDIFKLKAQLICRFYPAEVIVKMSGIENTQDGKNPQLVQAAMALLKDETLREFDIQVESDTLAQIDESQEKSQAVEFTQAVGSYFQQAVPLLQAAPYMAPLVGELLMFNVRRFKVGRSIEAAFDSAMQQMSGMLQQQMNAPKPPDPNAIMAQAETVKAQAGVQTAAIEGKAKTVQAVADVADANARLHQAHAARFGAAADIAQAVQQMSQPQPVMPAPGAIQ